MATKSNTVGKGRKRGASVDEAAVAAASAAVEQAGSEVCEAEGTDSAVGGADVAEPRDTRVDQESKAEGVEAEGLVAVVNDSAREAFARNRTLQKVYVLANGMAFAEQHFAEQAAQELDNRTVATLTRDMVK